MKSNKYLLIFLSILILFVFITSASAADANKTELLSIDESVNLENNNTLALYSSSEISDVSNDNNVIENNNNNKVLKAPNSNDGQRVVYVNATAKSGGDGSKLNPFKTLNDALTDSQTRDNDMIMIASGEYTGKENINLIINNTLYFEKYGDGEVIFDAQGLSRIWTVTANSININGLTFKNGRNDNDGGGAVYVKSNYKVINCNFTNNFARFGGAICCEGVKFQLNNGTVTDCSFINNTAKKHGGAIAWKNVNGTVTDCTFTNNTANDGGAIYWFSDNGTVTDCTFTNNTAFIEGGAIYISRDISGNLIGTFINNNAESGGAIYISRGGISGNLIGTFINNTAENGNAILLYNSTDSFIQDSVFINNNLQVIHGKNITAINCWFGSNAINYQIKPMNVGNVTMDSWLYLDGTSDLGPEEVGIGKLLIFTFELILYNSTSNILSLYDASKMNLKLDLYSSGLLLSETTALIGEPVLCTKDSEISWVTGKIGTASYIIILNSITDINSGNNTNNNSGKNFWYVDQSAITNGNGKSILHPFQTVGDAITFSKNNDIIMIAPGEYKGKNNVNIGFNKNLKFVTYGNGEVIFDGEGLTTIWFVEAKSISINGLTFKNGKGKAGGALCFLNAVTNCNINATFINNQADFGGAIFINQNMMYSNLTGTFINNQAVDSGGAIFINQNMMYSNLTGTFINNKVKYGDGGAIYFVGSGNVTNCEFINNTVFDVDSIVLPGIFKSLENIFKSLLATVLHSGNGGAIYWNGANGTVTDCNFTGNTAGNGGAIYWFSDNGAVSDCNFINNIATDYGGAIYWNGADGSVTDCNFTNNIATDYGGAIYWNGVNGSVTDCIFTNNTAQYGGAIWWNGGVNGSVTGCNFINNTAKYNGGAIYWNYGANGNVTNCNFTNNTAKYNGGAIHWNHGTNGNVTNCNFINNTAKYNGGAIRWFAVNGTVTDCTFTNNTATDYGGAINWNSANGTVTDCNFINNIATNYGGAINWNSANGTVTDCTFINNTATNYAGAINWNGANGNISDCTFTNNTATNYGGAINWKDAVNGTVNNCALVNNTAPTGTEIYIERGTTNLNYNWWGSNNPNWGNLIETKDETATYELSVYAILNMTASPNEIYSSEKSDITTKFVWNGTNTDATNLLPKRNIKLSSNGTLTETEGTVGLTSRFSATSDSIYYVNATVDNETIRVNLKVNPIIPTNIPTNISIDTFSLDLIISEIGVINATLHPLEAGDLTFTSNDTNIVTVDNNGIVTAVAEGSAIITVSFTGSEGYAPAENRTVTVTVRDKPTPRKDLNISGRAKPITVGENITIVVMGLENATGNVTARVQGGTLSAPIVNGTATFIVSNVISNTTAFIDYKGDEYYNPASTTVEIIVNPNPDKKTLTLNATAEPIIAGENVTIIVTGFENATGDVTARMEGGLLSTSIVNGTATFIVSDVISNTTAFIDYKGDDNYNPASTTVNITVIPKSDINIVAENVTKYYHGPERFVANIYDSELNPIANKSVGITINGITYTRTTDDKGTVSLAINLGSGTYDVTTTVDNTTVKSSITVLSTVNGSDITKYYRNATQYSVHVFDTTGKAVGAGEVVTFNINGVFYNRTTDENGIATLNINLPPSNYIIASDYKGCKVANNITVLPVLSAEDLEMKYMDGSQFKANLVDGQGNLYKNQFVTFNVNGILYNRLTDSNGQAALNIRLSPGEYIITSSFNGCNIANKITING